MRLRLFLAASVVLTAAAVPLGQFMLQSVAVPALHVRHCNFQAYAVSGYPGDGQDFNFTLLPG